MAKKWLGTVQTKVSAPKGLFSKGSAQDIAKWTAKTHSTKRSAIAALNFFCNRNSNISRAVCNKVDRAKSILDKIMEG